jgi:cell division protein FtsB
MEANRKTVAVGAVVIFATAFSLAAYFTFAAVQGEFGLFRRIQIEAGEQGLIRQLAALELEVAVMENKTRRLSDNFLDLDLLDEQARKVLGYVRGDEIVIR